jgi:hypothetical protein
MDFFFYGFEIVPPFVHRYVFAAAELGIRHEVMDLQNVPTVHKLITTSIIHYHVEVPLKNGKELMIQKTPLQENPNANTMEALSFSFDSVETIPVHAVLFSSSPALSLSLVSNGWTRNTIETQQLIG